MQKDRLEALLLSPRVDVRLEELAQSGDLLELFPEVHAMVGFGGEGTGHKDLWGHTKQVVAQCVQFSSIRWAALFHDVGKVQCFTRDEKGWISFHHHEEVSARLFKQAARRTRLFSKGEVEEIRFLIANLGLVEAYESSWTDSAVRRLYRNVREGFNDLVSLARADITTKHAHKRSSHLYRMKELKDRAHDLAAKDAIPPALPTGLGEVLSKEFEIPPSKALGDLIKVLKQAVENGDLERQTSVEEIVQYVKERKLV